MRLLRLLASSENAEAYKKTSENLREDYGTPIIQQRRGIIPPEAGAFEKLRRLQTGGTGSN
jgi:hypothetical protein